MENNEEMSNRIEDLKNENIQNLSENIQKELDEGIGNDYMNSNLEELQQLQLKQLQELQKIQETQLMQQVDSEDLSESEEEKVVEKKSSKNNNNKKSSGSMLSTVQKLLQEPLTLLVLYVFLSHNYVLNNMAKFIPSLITVDEDVSIKNLFIRGIILISIYFTMKMFIFK